MATRETTIFFHGDADGCCSAALLILALGKRAKKLVPVLEPSDLKKKRIPKKGGVVFLDLGTVTREMVNPETTMVIDHHLGHRLPCVHVNPTLDGHRAYPASYLVYLMFGGPKSVARAGCVGDWFLPPGVKGPIERAYYKSKSGRVARAIDSTCALLGEKGAILSVESLLRGKIGRTMQRCLETVTCEVDRVIEGGLKTEGRLASLVFSSRHRIKSQVAQLLKVRHKRKIVFVGQLTEGMVKFSMREGTRHVNLDSTVRKCLKRLRGGGGGHYMAVGGWVDEKDFDRFMERLKVAVNRTSRV